MIRPLRILAIRIRFPTTFLLGLPIFLGSVSCLEIPSQENSSEQSFPPDQSRPAVILREVASEVGLNFHHFTGATGEFYLPEIMGAGAALFDYDGDGDLDVYLVQGALLDKSKRLSDALFPPSGEDPPRNSLFRNNLIESGELRFVDVTEKAGIGHEGYGMGAAVGDYDKDGDLDLYLTNFGSNVLYRNNRDGTFTDITRHSGVDDPRWSASAAFLDYDLDGDLDLFVTNYVNFTVKGAKDCYHTVGVPDYCSPSIYEPLPDRLFRNEGNGRFVNVTERAGIGDAFGAGLGVACRDFNSDGWRDIYVANDGTPNQLWINQGDGTFEDLGLMSGTAYNANGEAEAGMGIAAGDFDEDGDHDLFVTHLAKETNTLYLNDGFANFHDATVQYDLAGISLPVTGFGTEWLDYDSDGDLDLFIVNGAVTIEESLLGEPYPYHQKNQLFRNEEKGKFRDISSIGGPALELSEVSRGAAFGDVDNDGDLDILISNNNGPARLLINEVGSQRHWLQIRLIGEEDDSFGVGARVAVLR
ncbi:MAG: FG-GAP repeat domain-containing protein, partial [Acidobacteriota bacterium]